MTWLLLQFLGAASVIVFAGVLLTRYADVLGERTGMGRTLAGALLLATATSLPELAVDCNLAYAGHPDLLLGDLLGSSLFNLLILAVLDLAHRGPKRIIDCGAAAHALSATMAINVTALCLLFLILPFDFTIGGIGPGPLLVAIVYALGIRLIYCDQTYARKLSPVGITEAIDLGHISLRHALIGYIVAAAFILIAAPALATAADGLATATGLGGTFMGTTLVALSTSLPEAVTTLAAIRTGAFDLAVGNILGSNTFNMLILAPADAFYDGSLLRAASPTHAVTAVCVILASTVTTLGLLYRPERRFWLIEPDAVAVIAIVLSSLGLVYSLR
jgi:cation:H+ antiporter